MFKPLLVLAFSGAFACCSFAQSLSNVPVHAKPVWHQVIGSSDGSGAMVAVQSLKTQQVIGGLPVGYKFLAFGGSQGIVTLAFNGEIGLIPASMVAQVNPLTTPPAKAPAGESTLEELADAYEKKVTTGAGVSLSYSNSIVEKTNKQSQLVGQGAIPGGVGVDMGMAGEYPQPGAALATGGPQGVGALVGVPQK